MFDMHMVEARSVKDIWEDVSKAVADGAPCFAGTFPGSKQEKYYQLEDEHNIKLYVALC